MNIHDMKQFGLILLIISVLGLLGGKASGYDITFEVSKPEGKVIFFMMFIGIFGMLLIVIDLAFRNGG